MIASSSQQTVPPLECVLNRLKGVRSSLHGWVACCPAHADREPSLSIGVGEDGQVLLKCFAGCATAHIVEAIGLTIADLFPGTPSARLPAGQARPLPDGHAPLSLLDLAQEKRLPWQFLFNLGVIDNDHGSVEITYHLPDGSLAPRHRIRTV